MKIKHFAGYGLVSATKVSKVPISDCVSLKNKTKLTIKVQGDYERGLEVPDVYVGTKWLLSKFEKNLPENYWDVIMTTEFGNDCKGEEIMFYTFIY